MAKNSGCVWLEKARGGRRVLVGRATRACPRGKGGDLGGGVVA